MKIHKESMRRTCAGHVVEKSDKQIRVTMEASDRPVLSNRERNRDSVGGATLDRQRQRHLSRQAD